jgi:L-ribulose-5-phosphate 3-epimerase/hexulose-6-phosphate isomerase
VRDHGGPAQLGVYEKALPGSGGWGRTCRLAAEAGFDFIEVSVDPSPEKLARLTSSAAERSAMRLSAAAAGIEIRTIVLSAHREFPWGSAEPSIRRRAVELADRAIALASDLGASCIQIAGYFTFCGPRSPHARELFVGSLRAAARQAADAGIVLAVENVDGTDVTSIADAQAVLRDVDESNVRLYIDVGNLAGNDRDVASELVAGMSDACAIQLKDARSGIFRRVAFGTGTVPFDAVFDVLVAGSPLPVSVEMWNDDGDPELAAAAAQWVRDQWRAACARMD